MGVIMVAAMLIILIYLISNRVAKALGDFSLIYFMETVAVFAFGVSWLVKCDTLLQRFSL